MSNLQERALRARFRLWIQNRDRSGLSRFNFFTAPRGREMRRADSTPRAVFLLLHLFICS